MDKWVLIGKSLRNNIGEITEKWLDATERAVNIKDRDKSIGKLELIDSIPALVGGISDIITGHSKDTAFKENGVFYDLALEFGKRRFLLGFDIDETISQCNLVSRILSAQIKRASLNDADIIGFHEIINQTIDLIQRAALKGYLQEYQIEMNERSVKDKLTGFFNRQSIVKMIDSEIYRSKRYRRPFSIAFLNIDGFSGIVEKKGSVIGNKLVKAVAEDVVKFIRASDIAARLHADVLTIVMPETTSDEAKTAVDRIRRSVKHESLRKNELITLSGGIIEVPAGGESVEKLFKKGKKALRLAEKDGGNITKLTK